MKTESISLLIFLNALLINALGSDRKVPNGVDLLRGTINIELSNQSEILGNLKATDPKTALYYTQILNHFDSTNTKTWHQVTLPLSKTIMKFLVLIQI